MAGAPGATNVTTSSTAQDTASPTVTSPAMASMLVTRTRLPFSCRRNSSR